MVVLSENDLTAPQSALSDLRAVLIDDHELVLDGLARLLERNRIHSVGMFVDSAHALDFLRGNPVDFVVVDLRLSGESGVSVLREVRALLPECRIAVLTSYNDPAAASDAVAAGANGFLLKSTLSGELGHRLRETAEGHLVVDAHVASAVLDPPRLLSKTELSVLRLVSDGLTNRDIGQRVYLSHYTVKDHLSKAMRKLGVSTRSEAVAKAVQQGLLETWKD